MPGNKGKTGRPTVRPCVVHQPPNINLITPDSSNWQAITGLAGNQPFRTSSSFLPSFLPSPRRTFLEKGERSWRKGWATLSPDVTRGALSSESWWWWLLLFLLISSHVPDPSGIEKGLERRKDLRGGPIVPARGRERERAPMEFRLFRIQLATVGTYTLVNRKTRPARWYPSYALSENHLTFKRGRGCGSVVRASSPPLVSIRKRMIL